jgi:hypothetical protein
LDINFSGPPPLMKNRRNKKFGGLAVCLLLRI